MNTVKFSDLIQNSGGLDGRLFVCFSYADSLTFKIQGSGLLVWVTGDEESKQLITDINDLIPQRDHKVRKNFKAFKQGVIDKLTQKGMTHAQPVEVALECTIPNLTDVVRFE